MSNLANKKKEETMIKRQAAISEIQQKYEMLSPHLNERGKRLYAGMEALSLGYKCRAACKNEPVKKESARKIDPLWSVSFSRM